MTTGDQTTRKKEGIGWWHNPRGSILFYIIVLIFLFSVVGSAMVAIYNSAIVGASTENYTKQAQLLAESGVRYAFSELRNTGYNRSVISQLNATIYSLSDEDRFSINVFGKWFRAAGAQNLAGGSTMNLNVPQGQIVDGFTIPDNLYVVNLEGYRDSIAFRGIHEPYIAQIQDYTKTSATSMSMTVKDGFQVDNNQTVCLAVYPMQDTTLTYGGDLVVPQIASQVFPTRYGSFYVLDPTTGAKRLYYYTSSVEGPTTWRLHDIRADNGNFPLDVTTGDPVILSERNHVISATGQVGTASGGWTSQSDSTDFLPNLTNLPGVELPAPLELSPDISASEGIVAHSSTMESRSDAVSVNTGEGTIDLGGGIQNASGAVWYSGDLSMGGVSGYCTGGNCQFNYGIRAFFTFTYQSVPFYSIGDGFTFTVMNGSNNGTSSIGGYDQWGNQKGEYMAYAGCNKIYYFYPYYNLFPGISPPKMAIEFDTHVNAGITARNDPQIDYGNDVLQYVFWGSNPGTNPYDGDFSDDNYHYDASGYTGGTDNPINDKGKYLTDKEDKICDADGTCESSLENVSAPHWLNSSSHAWAVRVEITRSTTASNEGTYTASTWIRQCQSLDCSEVLGSYYEDTRIAYEAKPAMMEQQFQLSTTYHGAFKNFLFGFTEATGSATQDVTISNVNVGFIRPGDPEITSDPQWP